jgi:hypothetical protein
MAPIDASTVLNRSTLKAEFSALFELYCGMSNLFAVRDFVALGTVVNTALQSQWLSS